MLSLWRSSKRQRSRPFVKNWTYGGSKVTNDEKLTCYGLYKRGAARAGGHGGGGHGHGGGKGPKDTGFVAEMRQVAMKLHTRQQAPKEGRREESEGEKKMSEVRPPPPPILRLPPPLPILLPLRSNQIPTQHFLQAMGQDEGDGA